MERWKTTDKAINAINRNKNDINDLKKVDEGKWGGSRTEGKATKGALSNFFVLLFLRLFPTADVCFHLKISNYTDLIRKIRGIEEKWGWLTNWRPRLNSQSGFRSLFPLDPCASLSFSSLSIMFRVTRRLTASLRPRASTLTAASPRSRALFLALFLSLLCPLVSYSHHPIYSYDIKQHTLADSGLALFVNRLCPLFVPAVHGSFVSSSSISGYLPCIALAPILVYLINHS